MAPRVLFEVRPVHRMVELRPCGRCIVRPILPGETLMITTSLPVVIDAQRRRWHGTIRLRPQIFGLFDYTIHFRAGSLQSTLFGRMVSREKAIEVATVWQRHLAASSPCDVDGAQR